MVVVVLDQANGMECDAWMRRGGGSCAHFLPLPYLLCKSTKRERLVVPVGDDMFQVVAAVCRHGHAKTIISLSGIPYSTPNTPSGVPVSGPLGQQAESSNIYAAMTINPHRGHLPPVRLHLTFGNVTPRQR